MCWSRSIEDLLIYRCLDIWHLNKLWKWLVPKILPMMLEVTNVSKALLAVSALKSSSIFDWLMGLFVLSEIWLCSKILITILASMVLDTIMNFLVSIEVRNLWLLILTWLKVLLQFLNLHAKGFSPVWTKICFVNEDQLPNDFEQWWLWD